MVRIAGCDPVGRGFESHRSPQYIMIEHFQHQIDTGKPCSGSVAFIGGFGLTDEQKENVRQFYREHVGQYRFVYLLESSLKDLTPFDVWGKLNRIWQDELSEFEKTHEFVGYFDNDQRYPVFKKLSG